MSQPVLWSFRRCPYAMRARLAVAVAGQPVTLKEIVLRDKPSAFLDASPSATVPCLDLGEGEILDESFDIMLWALRQNDPDGWLDMPSEGFRLIEQADGAFKTALDRYKYASRHADADPIAERSNGAAFINQLETQLNGQPYLFGQTPTLADMAILPFVRQFAHVDLDWFSGQSWPSVIAWLEDFKASTQFRAIMQKYPAWQTDQAGVPFP